MKKLQFTVHINAPANKVYDNMLGISHKSTYAQWTAKFNPTSSYEGNWAKGSKMLFVGTDEKGKKAGMVSEIFDLIPNKFVSIRHYGLVQNDIEITTGPQVEKWANGFENYSFNETDGTTLVTVDLDTADEFVDYMSEAFPNALKELKVFCEA